MNALLVLENGAEFRGSQRGAAKEKIGKVVLQTAVVGYQEAMTDTTNAGNIVVLTYPLIGNYGINRKFDESDRAWVSGIVVKEISRMYSNWMSEKDIVSYCRERDVSAISDVDTRTVAVTIRDHGEMLGIISDKDSDRQSLVAKIRRFKTKTGPDFIKETSIKKMTVIKNKKAKGLIAVYDIGINRSFVRQLEKLNFEIIIAPAATAPGDILRLKPRGVIIPNGPENDVSMPMMIDNVKRLIGKVPLLGFSTGHHIIACACGGRTKPMKIGHRGVNYPVKCHHSPKGEITTQNHSWVVDKKSVQAMADMAIHEINLNDGTIESLISARKKILSVQYYPVSPGFDEVSKVFRHFISMIA